MKHMEQSVVFDEKLHTPPENKYQSPVFAADKSPCAYCTDKCHSLNICSRLFKLSPSERFQILKKMGLCYGCLKQGHQRRDCRFKYTCQHCQGRHPTVLHYGNTSQNEDSSKIADKEVASVNNDNFKIPGSHFAQKISSNMGAGDEECTMAIVPVKVRMKNSMKEVQTYAFLDPGSNVSFVTDGLLQQIGGHGQKRNITMNTMGVCQSLNTYRVQGLEVCDLNSVNMINLPPVYTKDSIPVSHDHIPTAEDICEWAHLDGVMLPQIEADIGLLIGNNVPDAYTPIELKTGPRGSPHAAKTLLGWVAWNIMRNKVLTNVHVHRADIIAIEDVEEKKMLNSLYHKSTNLDFPEHSIDDRKEHSQEDRKFLEKVTNTMEFVNSHYQLCLPFRDQGVNMPDNSQQTVQRFQSLSNTMTKHSNLHEDNKASMNCIIDNAYAEIVSSAEPSRYDCKPDKLHIFCDCAAVHRGISLDSVVLQSPDPTNSLHGILPRSRLDSLTMMSDIESTFHKVCVPVPEQDYDYLQFYWWSEGELETPHVVNLTAAYTGAVLSPSCSNLTLRQAADDNQIPLDRVTKEVVLKNLYEDNLLKYIATEQEATTQVYSGCGDTPLEEASAVSWYVESYVIGSGIILESLLPTRRNILSTNMEVQLCYRPCSFGEMGQVQCIIIVRKATVPSVKHLTIPGSVNEIHYSLHSQHVCRLDYEEPQVVSCELESIRNGLPISGLSDDPSVLDLCTPDKILLQCPGPTCYIIRKYDNYARRCCQQVRNLPDTRWKMWCTKYPASPHKARNRISHREMQKRRCSSRCQYPQGIHGAWAKFTCIQGPQRTCSCCAH